MSRRQNVAAEPPANEAPPDLPVRVPQRIIIGIEMKHWTARLALLVVLSLLAQAQSKLTVEQLISFIKSSVQLHQDDRQIASYIKKSVKLSNRLDARTVEDLQGAGAGPQTVAALKMLITESASLAPPPPPAPKLVVEGPPPPDSIEQKRILQEITEHARNYVEGLPNFICLQVTRRYGDVSGLENYRLIDTIAERLSYYDQKEDYKVVSINGIPALANAKHEQKNGASSSGEFGSILKEIFAPETETQFDWERWATLRGKRMYVFNFRVSQLRSQYSIYSDAVKRTVIAGYHGLVYADRDTKMVMRIKLEVEGLPVDFPIQSVDLDMNYDFTKISGQEYLLPLKSEIQSREGRFLSKNEVEFRMYNRFGTETNIQFGDVPDALPDDATKEQPAK
jgi:hypothetical protein